MKKNHLYTVFLIFFSFALNIHVLGQKKIKQKQPNVLLIIVDDYGWRDIHSYGSDFYETPNMDKLISQSMKFTQAYATYPRCVPSRYSLMTGTHPARMKGDGEGKGDEDGESGYSIKAPNISIGQAMKNNGYHTFYVGKWHLGAGDFAPMGRGFDTSIAAGGAGATSSHFAPYNVRKNGTQGKEVPILGLDNAPAGECLEDRLTDETIKLINQSTDKPFFGVLAHYAVHTPIQAKETYINYFKEKLKNHPIVNDSSFEKEISGENKLYQDHPVYAAMIKSVDEGIGKILESLEKNGMSKNTIVIVTSDHGGLSSRGNNREVATSNRPLRAGKGHLYEGGLRVPLFIRWPGVIKEGIVNNSIVQGLDLFPTILDMVGIKYPDQQKLDGKSFFSVLKTNENLTTRTIFWHNPAPRPKSTGDIFSSAVRSGDYKLIDFYGLKKQELYFLKDDIGESENLIGSQKDIADSLYKKLVDWRANIGADMSIKLHSLSDAEKTAQGITGNPAEEKKLTMKEEKKEEKKAEKKKERREARGVVDDSNTN